MTTNFSDIQVDLEGNETIETIVIPADKITPPARVVYTTPVYLPSPQVNKEQL